MSNIKFYGKIEGECINTKEFNNFKELSNYYTFAACLASNITTGYNKTYITIKLNNATLLNKHRIDLNYKSNNIFRYELKKDIDNYISYMKRIGEKLTTKNLQEIELLKNTIMCLHEFNTIKLLYQYEFYHKSKKVHEYTLTEKATEKEIKTTLGILAGTLKGYGTPLNIPIQELRVHEKEIQLQF